MNDTTPEGVKGSWEISIKWKENATSTDIDAAQGFVEELDKEVNSEDSTNIPACIDAIILKKI